LQYPGKPTRVNEGRMNGKQIMITGEILPLPQQGKSRDFRHWIMRRKNRRLGSQPLMLPHGFAMIVAKCETRKVKLSIRE
jgi:hypothetical protein